MRMVLLKSSPNFQRQDMDIPALLFLSTRWGQKKETSKKTCEGICCGWGTRGLTHKFLRADASPWGFVVDSGGLSSWNSLPSARLCRGRQHEGDWRKTWTSWWQHWGEESEGYIFTCFWGKFKRFCHLLIVFAFIFSFFCPLKKLNYSTVMLLHKIIIWLVSCWTSTILSKVLEYQRGPPDRWVEIGNLQDKRAYHAVVSIGTRELSCLKPWKMFRSK